MYVGYDCWFTLHYEDEMFYTRAIYQTAILNISRGELQNIYRTFIWIINCLVGFDHNE